MELECGHWIAGPKCRDFPNHTFKVFFTDEAVESDCWNVGEGEGMGRGRGKRGESGERVLNSQGLCEKIRMGIWKNEVGVE